MAPKGKQKTLGPSEKEGKKEKEKEVGLAKASGASASSGLTKAAEESGNNGKEQKGLAKASTPAPPTPASEVDYGGSTSELESHQPKKEKKKEDKKAALTKGEVPLSLTCKPNKKVAVDWHGVLVIDDFHKPSNNFFLQKLHKAGFEVHCLSFCGYKRAQEVWNWAWHEWENWASVSFTWKPCGEDGKTEWCLNHDITMLVDDRGDICSEAMALRSFQCSQTPQAERRNSSSTRCLLTLRLWWKKF